MDVRKAVVIAVDGFRASALGAYGNTWYGTPAPDELAAESVLVDWMYRESPDLAGFYCEAWCRDVLPRLLTSAGVDAALLTDDPAIAAIAEAASFGEVTLLDSSDAEQADDVSGTALASLMAIAANKLALLSSGSSDDSSLLWIHARGFHGTWDAPQALRASLLEDDDPEAPTFVMPPQRERVTDHDVLLGMRAAYAAQAIVLDQCVGAVLAALADAGAADHTLVSIVGTRGFALGEHGWVGAEADALYSERLHVPCLVRAPSLGPVPQRWASLATPRDLLATLASWFRLESPAVDAQNLLAAPSSVSAYVCVQGRDGERAIRTPAWFLRRAAARAESSQAELYVKPDDRWEANEVADRCRDVVDRLLAALQCVDQGESPSLRLQLDGDLVAPVR